MCRTSYDNYFVVYQLQAPTNAEELAKRRTVFETRGLRGLLTGTGDIHTQRSESLLNHPALLKLSPALLRF
jgi:hypothetical protein